MFNLILSDPPRIQVLVQRATAMVSELHSKFIWLQRRILQVTQKVSSFVHHWWGLLNSALPGHDSQVQLIIKSDSFFASAIKETLSLLQLYSKANKLIIEQLDLPRMYLFPPQKMPHFICGYDNSNITK